MVSLIEGKWSFYRGGKFNREKKMVVTEVAFNGGSMVMLLRWPV